MGGQNVNGIESESQTVPHSSGGSSSPQRPPCQASKQPDTFC